MRGLLAYVIAYALIVVIMLAGFGAYRLVSPSIYAAPSAKNSDPDCVEITVDNASIRVWECESPTGQTFILNSVGFMVIEQ